VVREDPDRIGLLYAGTEFGIYVSFDNGTRWQSFQMNLPVTPITDIKVSHQDLVLSTQGRSFWILDDLTPLHQLSDKVAASQTFLFQPRKAVRTPARGALEGLSSRTRPGDPQYPRPGAMIDYYLAKPATDEITLEILDGAGRTVRKFSSVPATQMSRSSEGDTTGSEEDEVRPRNAPIILDTHAGMHRFTWDLRYSGPWQSQNRPEGSNGPMAVPGKYTVRLTSASWTGTQPLVVVEDPRITKDGVTQADLQEQFEYNLRARELVSDVNKAVARIRTAQASLQHATGTDTDRLAKLNELASHLITPPIRYSKPELQTHITYLYTLTNSTDQKIGRDAQERYAALRKELDERLSELNTILGPQK
jgi:hypothetical protein